MKNREIKFRAWYGGIMFHSDSQESAKLLNIPLGKSIIGGFMTAFTFDETLMQFTGLLDKNGKEIYEGDILQVEEQGYYGGIYNVPVEWLNWNDKNVVDGNKGHHWAFFGCVCMKAKEIKIFHPTANTIFTRGFLTRRFGSCIELSEMTYGDRFNIEIIGNIYQHPELLK